MQLLNNLKDRFEISFIFNQLKQNKSISIFIIVNIFIVTLIEMFVLGSLIPIINLFNNNQKIIELVDKINTFFSLSISFENFLIIFFSLIIIFFLVSGILQFLHFLMGSKLTEKIFKNWKNQIIANYLSQEVTYFTNKKTGDLIQKSLVHSRDASLFIFELLLFIKELIISFALLIFLIYLSVSLSFLFFIVFVLIFFNSFYLAKKYVYNKSNYVAIVQEKIFNIFTTLFNSIKVIKAYHKEKYFLKKINAFNEDYFLSKSLVETMVRVPSIINRTVTYVFAMIILGGLLLFYNSPENISLLIIFIAGVYKINNSLSVVNNSFLSMTNLAPSLKIVKNQIDLKNKKIFNENLIQEDLKVGKFISYENISFKYPDSSFEINLKNLKFNKGNTYCIYGDSGTGKSTLLDILCNFNKTNLKFLVDDNKIDLNFVPKNFFGYLNQNSYIFPDTIKENINFYNEKKNTKNYNKAIEISGLEKIIERFALKDNSLIEEFGSNISGGQKQRMSLARLINGDIQVYILDEATNNLDHDSELSIMKKLINWIKENNKILIYVTHSSNIQKLADNTIEIEHTRKKA